MTGRGLRGLWIAGLLLLALGAHAEPLAQQLERADRLLQQAEQQPARAGELAREAESLLPKDAAPGVGTAAKTPNRVTLQRARREVAALRTATAPPAVADTPGTDARGTLKQVLAQKQFQSLKPTPKTKWQAPHWPFWSKVTAKWNQFWRGVGNAWGKFTDWLGSLFKPLTPPKPHPVSTNWLDELGGGLRVLLWVVVAVAVLFLLGFITSQILAAYRRRKADEAHAARTPGGSPLTSRKQEPTYWERSLTQAEALWARGDQREALRTISRACLVLLDARGVLRYDETRANGEVLRELRRQGKQPVMDALRPIVRTVDRSWYGYLPVSDDEFGAVLEGTQQFRTAVVGEANHA